MIVLTGATGSVGGNLASRGERAKALVRRAEDGERLRAMGHEPVQGDLREADTLATG